MYYVYMWLLDVVWLLSSMLYSAVGPSIARLVRSFAGDMTFACRQRQELSFFLSTPLAAEEQRAVHRRQRNHYRYTLSQSLRQFPDLK